MTSRHAGQQDRGSRSAGTGGKRDAFRDWRRSRPFWGGLLLLIAGIELLAIPLSGVLIKGQVKLVIYIGIGGVFGVLIGALLIAAGIVVWVNPTHRVFYGIAGVVLGILSFPASNLGGFFIGMLLAIVGGALAFAWTPGAPQGYDPPPRWLGPGGSGPAQGSGPGYRFMAAAAMPAVVLVGLVGSSGAAGKKPGPVYQVPAPAGLVAPSATSVLTAKSSSMTKFNFSGVATLPVGGGGSEKALAFTASSASLSGVRITVTQSGKTVGTTTTSVGFPREMTLYTTKLCGQVEGIAPNLCFTPNTASQIALKLASVLGGAGPVSMTNVTADQFINLSPSSRWGTLHMATQ